MNSTQCPSATLSSHIEPLTQAIEAIRGNAATEASVETLFKARDSLVEQLLSLPKLPKNGSDSERIIACLEGLLSLGALDQPRATSDLDRHHAALAKGWAGTLAALLTAPAWQFAELPAIDSLPPAFWPVYARALLHMPATFSHPGEATAVCNAYVQRLQQLVRLIEANRGAAAARSAAEAFLADQNFLVPVHCGEKPAEILELKARLLRALQPPESNAEIPAFPRDLGRKLKVCFVVEDFSDKPHNRFLLPLLESLDPSRFEVLLRPLHFAESSLLDALRDRGVDLQTLEEDPREVLRLLTESVSDIMVFCTDLCRGGDQIAHLAFNRIAPLQLCLERSTGSLSLPGSNLELCWTGVFGNSQAPGVRKAILPFPGMLPVGGLSLKPATRAWSRNDLQFGENEVVYVSMASFASLTPEIASAWARILAAVPDSKLILCSYAPEDANEAAVTRVFTLLSSAFRAAQVEDSRLIIGNENFECLADVQALMSVGDLYLATVERGYPEDCLLALLKDIPALELCPTGATQHHLAHLYGQMNLSQLACADLEAYVREASRLGSDKGLREATRTQLRQGIGSDPLLFDITALGVAWGGLLERCYDELAVEGLKNFAKKSAPLRCELTGDLSALLQDAEDLRSAGLHQEADTRVQDLLAAAPTDARLLKLHRQGLESREDWARLTESLICAIEQQGDQSEHWLQLSKALMKQGKKEEGLKALQTCVRIDPKNLENWLLLSEHSAELGDTQLNKDVGEVLRNLAPEDPRVIAYLKSHAD